MNSCYKIIVLNSILFSLLMIGCRSTAPVASIKSTEEKDCCISNYQKFEYIPLIELGAEYKKLRNTNESCCNKNGSALYLVMKELGKQLGKKGTHKAKILEVMGKADTNNQQELRYHLGNKNAGIRFVIKNNLVSHYEWLDIV